MTHTSKAKRPKSSLRRLIALSFGLLAAFTMAEVVLRIYNPLRSTVRANDIVLPAFKTFVTESRNKPKISEVMRLEYNSLGFGGPEPPADFTERTTVITVGGSTTECGRLSDGYRWPDELRRVLTKRIDNLWLNNAGFNGHSTFGHSILLREYIAKLRPKYVFFLVGLNEIGRDDINKFDIGLRPEDDSLRNRIVYLSEVLSTFQTVQRMFRTFDLGVRDDPSMEFAELEEFKGTDHTIAELRNEHSAFLDSYHTRLSACMEICTENGIHPVLITQSALYSVDVDPTTGVDIGSRSFHGMCSAREKWRILELYNDVTRTVADEHQIPLIDLAAEMPKDSKYYYDWVHYSLDGAVVVGRIVGEDFATILGK